MRLIVGCDEQIISNQTGGREKAAEEAVFVNLVHPSSCKPTIKPNTQTSITRRNWEGGFLGKVIDKFII